jgi:hypothetical protein
MSTSPPKPAAHTAPAAKPAAHPAPAAKPAAHPAAKPQGQVKPVVSAEIKLVVSGPKMPLKRTASLTGPRAGVAHFNSGSVADGGWREAQEVFPGLKTFLWYASAELVGDNIKWGPLQNMVSLASGQGQVVQIGFEANQDLNDYHASLASQGDNGIKQHLKQWAEWIKDQGPIVFRPLSEMNDSGNTWTLEQHSVSTYVETWKLLHDFLDRHGATNLLWAYDPYEFKASATLAPTVMQALEALPAGYVDALGLHPYTRLPHPVPFDAMAEPWLREFKHSKHAHGKRIIGEMGVGDDTAAASKPKNHASKAAQLPPAWDKLRQTWIADAFRAAKGKFDLVTYFNQYDKTWSVRDNSPLALAELKKQIASFG